MRIKSEASRKKNFDLNELLQSSQRSEALLKDETCILKETALENEREINRLQNNEESLKQEIDIELNLLNEKNELLEKKIEACEKAFASSTAEMKAEPALNNEESLIETMNRELNNIQSRCTELQECNLSLASKITALMGNQDKYKILCEKYSTLERKSGEYESEIYDLQKKLSQVELHTKSWADFFSEHEEFDSVDSLWVKYSNCQEQLKALTENQKKSGEESKQLEQQINKLKGELQLATENASSVSKLLSDVRNSLSRAEKLNVFAKKENELLKRQLDINFGIAFSSKDQSQAVPQEVLTLLDQTKKLRETLSNEFK
ncbi:hypothetical protein DSO57_1037767 [Entomophthora muscae]|uniref:Uncharacterized protein n=1 Tax=Entomophthora muscae TaxID=34485 RepID=A0ACC2U8A0_9FUNG|nr:hypothetical protein DSO57_1037767 [Entomophthora muscae]